MEVLRAGLKKDERLEDTRAYQQYWADTPEARRARVMPFFWTEWMTAHGSIAGNRAAGSKFGITNTHRFSYPGYAEILTGEPHDAVIDSNDDRRYPFPTLLDVAEGSIVVIARTSGGVWLVGDVPVDRVEPGRRLRRQRRLSGARTATGPTCSS